MDIFSPDRLHVLACDAASGGLRKAASDCGQPLRWRREDPRRNLIVFSPTFLTVGPISGIAAPEEHVRWLETNAPGAWRYTGLDGYEAKYIREVQDDWSLVRGWRGPTTLWYSSRSVAERSLFLAYVSAVDRILDADIVDVARLAVAYDYPVLQTGSLASDRMPAAAAHSFRLSRDQLASDRAAFRRLDEAPGGVRLLEGGELVQAPLHAHDANILRRLDHKWKRLLHVAGDLMTEEHDRGAREVEYSFLLWRLEVLCREGRIERRGESKQPLYNDDPLKGEVRRL